jgi:hypothetical protein
MKTDTLQITLELLNLLSEVDEFKGAWRALGTLAPERLNALRHVATIESIGSSCWSTRNRHPPTNPILTQLRTAVMVFRNFSPSKS